MSEKVHISEEELELIDRYLNEQLSHRERFAFEQKLAEDSSWRKKLEEVFFAALAIREKNLGDKLNDFHKEMESEPAKMVPIKRNYLKWIAVAAAIVLLIISALLFFNSPDQEKLYANYFQQDPGLSVVMGNETKSNYTLYDGTIDYKEGNFTKAIEKWTDLGDKTSYNDTLNFYIAMANMNSGNLDQAIGGLDSVIEDKTSPFYQKALWYRALIHLKKENMPAAENLLKQINEFPEANALLKDLSR